MRVVYLFKRSLPLAAAVILCGLAGPSPAGDLYGERVHADSFGNLVIHSASGYKRIVVGRGYLAAQLKDASRGDDPDVVYYEAPRPAKSYEGRCRTVPGLFKGRSYMYGLPDGVVPTPARTICD